MKLKGLGSSELKSLENRLKSDIVQLEKNMAAQRIQVKRLKNDVCQVRTRRRQLDYKERLKEDFSRLQRSL